MLPSYLDCFWTRARRRRSTLGWHRERRSHRRVRPTTAARRCRNMRRVCPCVRWDPPRTARRGL